VGDRIISIPIRKGEKMKTVLSKMSLLVLLTMLIASCSEKKESHQEAKRPSQNSIEIISLSPETGEPLYVGEKMTFKVKVKYHLVNADSAKVTLFVDQANLKQSITKKSKTVLKESGTVTMKSTVEIPDTTVITIVTALYYQANAGTSVVDFRSYKVVEKNSLTGSSNGPTTDSPSISRQMDLKDDSVQLVSVSPETEKPLHVGEKVTFEVKVKYNLASVDSAIISLVVQTELEKPLLADESEANEIDAVVLKGSGIVTLKSTVEIPYTTAITIDTPLYYNQGNTSTLIVDSRRYTVQDQPSSSTAEKSKPPVVSVAPDQSKPTIPGKRGEPNQDLLHAASNDNLQGVQDALEAGADVNTVDNNGYPALIWAAHYGNVPMIKLLLKKGAHIDQQNYMKETALIRAAVFGNKKEVIEILLKNGADVNIENKYGQTALWEAVNHKQKGSLDVLLEYSDLQGKPDEYKHALLGVALLQEYYEIADCLLENGIDVNVKDEKGRTLLMLTVFRGFYERSKFLLDRGADIKTKSNDGNTALMLAEQANHEKIVQLLKSYETKQK
jgi:ankyrin repeat protein